jgi:hypothetical protein
MMVKFKITYQVIEPTDGMREFPFPGSFFVDDKIGIGTLNELIRVLWIPYQGIASGNI